MIRVLGEDGAAERIHVPERRKLRNTYWAKPLRNSVAVAMQRADILLHDLDARKRAGWLSFVELLAMNNRMERLYFATIVQLYIATVV